MIYMDNAATTKVDAAVLEAMLPYLTENYCNPSAFYRNAQKVRDRLEEARETFAIAIGAASSEVFFTSGGTESNNFAIKQVAMDYSYKGKHIITTKIEHHSILHSCASLERSGFEITYLDVDANGLISLDELENAIRSDTILISIMFANNEIGNILPIKEIAKIAEKRGVLFHTDAIQAFGSQQIDVKELKIDLMSCSGHKIHAPKGVGGLYISNRVKVKAYLTGGAQEKKRRAGTENVSGIVGFQKAIEILRDSGLQNAKKIRELREYFEKSLTEKISGVTIHAKEAQRLPGISNFRMEGFRNEDVLIQLDMEEICASGGSACTTGSLEPSHVLLALGLENKEAMQGLRFSFGKWNTKEEVDLVLKTLVKITTTNRR